jgi:hypothetical protein
MMLDLEEIQIRRADEQVARLTSWPKHDPDLWDVVNSRPLEPLKRRVHCWECDAPPSSTDHGYCQIHHARVRLHGTVDVDERTRRNG